VRSVVGILLDVLFEVRREGRQVEIVPAPIETRVEDKRDVVSAGVPRSDLDALLVKFRRQGDGDAPDELQPA
jgi:hypothetical protein